MFKKISVSVLMMAMVLLITVTTAFGATNSDISPYEDSAGNVNIEGASVPNAEFAFAGSNITANSVFDTTTFLPAMRSLWTGNITATFLQRLIP